MEISAYLAELVKRETAPGKGLQLQELAKRAGVTPAQLSTLRSTGTGAGWRTLIGLAKAFDMTLGEVEANARAFAEGVDVFSRPPPASQVEYDQVRQPTFGALPGWAEAEADARRKYRRIPDAAWVGARALAGMKFPERGQVTPEFVLSAAQAWQQMQSAMPQSEDELAKELAEDARLDAIAADLKAKKK